MLKVEYPIIVEGRYDKAFLKSFLDATVITTEGFGVYKNKEFASLVKTLAISKKVIVLTDSDNAGKQIRNHLKNIINDIEIINLYTPQIKGKEKRKNAPSKEGFLGVEGQEKQTIIDLLKDFQKNAPTVKETLTKTDLFSLGLSGTDDSKSKRIALLKKMNLPLNLSTNMLLDAINSKYTKEEFIMFYKEK